MRDLETREIAQVSGGSAMAAANLTPLVGGTFVAFQFVGMFSAGYLVGSGINNFNQYVSGMSFGEAMYHSVN